MTDTRSEAVLGEILGQESRSLLLYISEAFPWVNNDESGILANLQTLIEEERQATAQLGQFLLRRRMRFPTLGAFPASFTTMNYISLSYLLPQLVRYEKREISSLEQKLPMIEDVEAQAQVRNLLKMKQRHLQTLEQLADNRPVSAAPVHT